MKKIIAAMVMVLVMTTQVFAGNLKDIKNDIPGNDTFNHIAGGSIVGGLTTHYLPKDWNPWVRIGLGILAGTAVGCISESVDKNWDNKDLAQWSLGGAMGASFISIEF